MTHRATTQPLEAHPAARPSRHGTRALVPALALVLGPGLSSGAQATAVALSACSLGQEYDNVDCGIDVDGQSGVDIEVVVMSMSNSNYFSAWLNARNSRLTFLVVPSTGGGYDVKRLAAGDVVDAAAFSSLSIANYTGYVYGLGAADDQWAAAGDTGFAAFRISSISNGQTVYNYGYLGLTRGSLTIDSVGYQTTAGQAAQIPNATPAATVPEPTSLALVAAAAGGMLAARRRRQAVAAASC